MLASRAVAVVADAITFPDPPTKETVDGSAKPEPLIATLTEPAPTVAGATPYAANETLAAPSVNGWSLPIPGWPCRWM